MAKCPQSEASLQISATRSPRRTPTQDMPLQVWEGQEGPQGHTAGWLPSGLKRSSATWGPPRRPKEGCGEWGDWEPPPAPRSLCTPLHRAAQPSPTDGPQNCLYKCLRSLHTTEGWCCGFRKELKLEKKSIGFSGKWKHEAK